MNTFSGLLKKPTWLSFAAIALIIYTICKLGNDLMDRRVFMFAFIGLALYTSFFISIIIADRIAVKLFPFWKVNIVEVLLILAAYAFYLVAR